MRRAALKQLEAGTAPIYFALIRQTRQWAEPAEARERPSARSGLSKAGGVSFETGRQRGSPQRPKAVFQAVCGTIRRSNQRPGAPPAVSPEDGAAAGIPVLQEALGLGEFGV